MATSSVLGFGFPKQSVPTWETRGATCRAGRSVGVTTPVKSRPYSNGRVPKAGIVGLARGTPQLRNGNDPKGLCPVRLEANVP